MIFKRLILYACVAILLSGCTKAVSIALVVQSNNVLDTYQKVLKEFEVLEYNNDMQTPGAFEYKTFFLDYNGSALGGYFYVSIYPDKALHRVVVIFSEVEVESSFSNNGIREINKLKKHFVQIFDSLVQIVVEKNKVEALHQFYWEKIRKD